LSTELAEDRYLYGKDVSKSLPKQKKHPVYAKKDKVSKRGETRRATNGVSIPANMQLTKKYPGR
jgi:hypothetical protein